MSDVSRRDLLFTIGTSMLVPPALAQHVHQSLAVEKPLTAKYFNAHEFQTLRRLAELIIPADAHSPGALDAHAPEFIDFLCGRNDDLAQIYTGGLAWIDDEMKRRYAATFIAAKAGQQTALLDLIAFRKNDAPEIAAGQRFFVWLRNMVVDAFYTSPVGVKDLGFMGNTAVATFSVPQEAIDYALKKLGQAVPPAV